ncbi:hypothetical protein ACFWUZ_24190 [Streptomyces sp. NPDC058646]|uniref:hypothetical protein n=1 Tax=Streptomyces sp. NPDC058646 TaxID=3346574 RepID=UPI0036475468
MLPLHCFVAGAVAAPAAALGDGVAAAHGSVPVPVRWLLCGSAGGLPIGGTAALWPGRGAARAPLLGGPGQDSP